MAIHGWIPDEPPLVPPQWPQVGGEKAKVVALARLSTQVAAWVGGIRVFHIRRPAEPQYRFLLLAGG